jgi:hypothetical protein
VPDKLLFAYGILIERDLPIARARDKLREVEFAPLGGAHPAGLVGLAHAAL